MRSNNPELIVMLTHNEHTVENAYEIFEQCKNSKAKIWGIKEKGLPLEQMKDLFAYMKKCGKTTVLEIVEYTENECLEGAKIALECGCDILMGTIFFDSVNDFCKKNNIKYMPFIGKVSARPSILEGTVEEMIDEANKYLEKGVYGVDLLGYRYTGNAPALIKEFVTQINAPVCIAGSVNSYERLDEIKDSSPWAFTIGGAFFDNKFGGSHEEQINKVCEYIKNSNANQNEINDYYNKTAQNYDNSRFGNSYGEFIDYQEKAIVTKLLKDIPRSQTLDMPCGTGRFLDFADFGIDASEKMLEIAKQKFPHLSLYQEDATKTHFNANTFSAITSFHFLMHLNKNTTKKVINECNRILKKNGILIIDFPSKYRKQLLGKKTKGWHCANDYKLDELLAINKNFKLKEYYGIMFFPVHRFSPKIRKMLRKIDTLLCRSFLRRYASFLVVVLEKQKSEDQEAG